MKHSVLLLIRESYTSRSKQNHSYQTQLCGIKVRNGADRSYPKICRCQTGA